MLQLPQLADLQTQVPAAAAPASAAAVPTTSLCLLPCSIRNDIDFKVLSELFDGVGDTRSMEVGSWWNTEQKRYSTFPDLKASDDPT